MKASVKKCELDAKISREIKSKSVGYIENSFRRHNLEIPKGKQPSTQNADVTTDKQFSVLQQQQLTANRVSRHRDPCSSVPEYLISRAEPSQRAQSGRLTAYVLYVFTNVCYLLVTRTRVFNLPISCQKQYNQSLPLPPSAS